MPAHNRALADPDKPRSNPGFVVSGDPVIIRRILRGV